MLVRQAEVIQIQTVRQRPLSRNRMSEVEALTCERIEVRRNDLPVPGVTVIRSPSLIGKQIKNVWPLR